MKKTNKYIEILLNTKKICIILKITKGNKKYMNKRMTKQEELNKLTNLQAREYVEHRNNASSARHKKELGNTGKSYLNAMLTYEGFLKEYKNLNDEELKDFDCLTLNLRDIKAFSDYLTFTKKLSPSTHNHRIFTIGGMLTYFSDLYDDVDGTASIRIEVLKKKIKKNYIKPLLEEETSYFKPNEMAKLYNTILNTKSKSIKKRMLAMFMLYTDTSNRCSEVQNFKFSDIHFSDKEGESFVITSSENKVGVEKKHYLKEATVVALKDYIKDRVEPFEEDKEYIFISNKRNKIAPTTIRDMFKNLYIEAGFGYIDEDGKAKSKYCVHSLRHSVITEVANNFGINKAKMIAGHSSITMTDRYAHHNEEEKKEIVNSIFNF